MEGYTNVIGSAYDFDDLDIEGRVVDEWNVQTEEKKTPRIPGPKFDEKSILSERVKLDNGQQTNVFSVTKKNDSTLYICHICTDSLVGVANLRQHDQSQKHRNNLSKPVHPRAKFVKLDPKENLSLEPGEPVPPGLEEVIIKNCAIQPKLDAYKSPLIGLEFVVELTEPSTYEEEYYYYCLLCEKTGSERNMLIHLTSIYHNLKYLSMYFPTVARKLHALPNRKLKKAFGLVVLDIVGEIEAKYGRMKPFTEARADFDTPGRMSELQKLVSAGPHLREKEGEYFDEKATAEYVDKKSLENLITPTVPGKVEDVDKVIENKEPTGSMFNKINRINIDKKQLRSREDEERNSSPDVQLVNIELPKPLPPKKRTRSRSLSSISTVSSSSSRNKSRYHRHSKLSSYSRPQRWSRSRSRSRSPRSRSPRSRYRRKSPYSRRYSPHRNRDRSPYRRRRPQSPDDRHREKLDRYGRSRDLYDSRSDRNRRERHEDRESPVKTTEEKVRWEKFRDELKTIENSKLEKLKYYEKNPEKHPQYPEEWKSFWNRRYNELQRSGIDPSKHDFKPEWISFWTKRMKELYEEDLNMSKNELKKKFDLPEDPDQTPWKQRPRRRNNTSPGLIDISPPTPDKKDVIADIKSTWKALTGSDIKDAPKRPLSPWEDDRSPPSKRDLRSPSPGTLINDKLLEEMPQRKTRTSSLIFVLRKLTVLEQQLGYLAPKVFELMQQALALEKIKEEASLDLLYDPENAFYLETVREKLIGLLCAGVVPRNMVNTSRSAIKHIDIALYLVSKRERVLPERVSSLPSAAAMAMHLVEPPRSDPVVVPGVGQVDKVAIAQQIATALIEQGRTNVSEAELEQLINAVVGMAEASANSTQPMTTANFLHQLQAAQNSTVPTAPVTNVPTTETAMPIFQPMPQISSEIGNTQNVATTKSDESQPAYGGLKLLQSAYNDSSKTEQESPKPEIIKIDSPKLSSHITDEKLAATLAMFNKTNKEDQPVFIQKLKISNPDMYKRLCPFIPISALVSPENSKRSPIIISLSKEKSEQKIKPISSGRLSPFSSRSGGANPTVGEGVIDVDEDIKLIGESSSRSLEENKQISCYKSNKIQLDENDDDDDDDDYSFEDVYRAAQESLKQKQVAEDLKSNQSTQNSTDSSLNNKLKDPSSINSNKSYELVTGDKLWNLESQEKSVFNVQENQQLNRSNVEEENKQSQYSSQQQEQFREIPSRVTQSAPYQSIGAATQNYQDVKQRRPESSQNYPAIEGYTRDSAYTNKANADVYAYSKANASEVYDKDRQYSSDASYYPNTTSYSNQSRDLYPGSYEDSYNNQSMNSGYGNNTTTNLGYGNNQTNSGYNNQTNPGYGNNMSMYGSGDPYRQRQQQSDYGSDNYGPWTQSRHGTSQRFPNSNYPSY